MILAIDCGNTHTSFGCVNSDGEVINLLKIPTDTKDTEFGYAVKIKEILELADIKPEYIDGAVISSVVPPITDILVKGVKYLIKTEVLVVGAGVKSGLHICINDPGTVASDLVCTAVAAKENYDLPCIIVDMGTATTVTAVDEKGRFIGGSIIPGVMISLNALCEKTALLPLIDMKNPEKAVALSTVDCMKSGIVYGSAGAVDALIDRFKAEMGVNDVTIVGTGGVSPYVCPYCSHKIILDETLIMKGLYSIWKRNTVHKKNKNYN